MTEIEWTDAEREALEAIQFGSYQAVDTARTALARLVAAREAQAAAKALREAEADYSHLYLTRGAAAKVVAAVTCADLRARADRIERGES